jgi:hypothetical protein
MLLGTLLQDSGSISGQILNASGAPAAAVRVSVMPADAQAANLSVLTAFAMTDSSGQYKIDNIEPGTYYVIAGLVAQPTYFPGVATQAGARTLAVRGGASITGLDFKIVTTLTSTSPFVPPTPPPIFSVSGKVDLQPGQKLPPYLRIIPTGLISAPVRPDGSFVATGLQAGTYWFETSLLPKSPDFIVKDKDIAGLTVTLPFTGQLTGSVETRTGSLPAPFSIWVIDAANPANRVGVSSAGIFELNLPEGAYRVEQDKFADGFSIDSITIDGANLQDGTFKMTPDARMRLVVTVSERPGPTSVTQPEPILQAVSGRIEREGATVGLFGLRFSDASGPRATVMLDVSLPDPTFRVAFPLGEYKVEAVIPTPGNPGDAFRVQSASYRSSDILSMPLKITQESPGEIRVVIGAVR